MQHYYKAIVPSDYRSALRLQTTGYRLQTTDYRLQATGYRLQNTGYRLQIEREAG